jgi:transposase
MKSLAPEPPRRRRFWSEEEERRIIAESEEAGASASVVAQRHGLNANLLFTWRRQLRGGLISTGAKDVTFVPVSVAPEPPGTCGRMEIVLAGGERILIGADVDAGALARVVKALSRR